MTGYNFEAWFSGLSTKDKFSEAWSTLSADQKLALYLVGSDRYSWVNILGRAGSGKTYVAKLARQVLESQGWEVKIVGTTGVASVNANGDGTINSVFSMGIGDLLPKGMIDFGTLTKGRDTTVVPASKIRENFAGKTKQTIPLAIFIDEISMASSELLLLFWQIIEEITRNRKVMIVCFGDMRQLLAVADRNQDKGYKSYTNLCFEPAQFQSSGEGEEIQYYGSPMSTGPYKMQIFNGQLQVEGSPSPWKTITMSLITNHRQKEAEGWFTDALNAIGDGENFNSPKVRRLRSRIWTKQDNGEYKNLVDGTVLDLKSLDKALHIYNRNKDVSEHNNEILSRAKQSSQSRKYYATIEAGTWSRDRITGDVRPILEETELVIGLRFMVRMNLNERLANGTVGTIVQLDKERIQLKLDTGEMYWVKKEEYPLPKGPSGIPVGKFFQVPGHLSHALTPWKTQGITVKEQAVVYHLKDWYANHGLMYVVCSRVTQPDQLFILAENAGMLNKSILCDPRVKEFIEIAENNTKEMLANSGVENMFGIEFERTDFIGSSIAHVFKLQTQYYCITYKDGNVSGSFMHDGNDWDLTSTVGEPIYSKTIEKIDELGLVKAVASEPQETEIVAEAIAEPTYLPVWSDNPNKEGYVMVRDHSVRLVGYVSHEDLVNKGATIADEGDDCILYELNNKYFCYIRNAKNLGELLMTCDEAFEFFKENVKCVFVDEEDNDSDQVTTPNDSENVDNGKSVVVSLAEKLTYISQWAESFISSAQQWCTEYKTEDDEYACVVLQQKLANMPYGCYASLELGYYADVFLTDNDADSLIDFVERYNVCEWLEDSKIDSSAIPLGIEFSKATNFHIPDELTFSVERITKLLTGSENEWVQVLDAIYVSCQKHEPNVKAFLKEQIVSTQSQSVATTVYYTGVGSRNTPKHILKVMEEIGEVLATQGAILRSGGADGADSAFEKGALRSAYKNNSVKPEVYLPWKGFNGKTGIIPNIEESSAIAKQYIEHWDSFNEGEKKLHSRNANQVLGNKLNQPSQFLICWTPNGEEVGGTATAIKIAKAYGVEVYNLAIKKDLDELVEKLGLTPPTKNVDPKVTVVEKQTPEALNISEFKIRKYQLGADGTAAKIKNRIESDIATAYRDNTSLVYKQIQPLIAKAISGEEVFVCGDDSIYAEAVASFIRGKAKSHKV